MFEDVFLEWVDSSPDNELEEVAKKWCSHNWIWYKGFVEQYYYCSYCDEKDWKRSPPNEKI